MNIALFAGINLSWQRKRGFHRHSSIRLREALEVFLSSRRH
nr:MAG TPA: hypothetical protein [Caudoviricetes sp.]